MNLLVISDIHGNIVALKEVLKYIENIKIDGIIGLGDYVTDIPRSHEVIECMKKLSAKYDSWIIKGNREENIMNYHQSKVKQWSYDNNTCGLLVAYHDLNEDNLNYIYNLKDELYIQIR